MRLFKACGKCADLGHRVRLAEQLLKSRCFDLADARIERERVRLQSKALARRVEDLENQLVSARRSKAELLAQRLKLQGELNLWTQTGGDANALMDRVRVLQERETAAHEQQMRDDLLASKAAIKCRCEFGTEPVVQVADLDAEAALARLKPAPLAPPVLLSPMGIFGSLNVRAPGPDAA